MRLIIRADYNESIGSGHIMRCFALAQGWKSNGGSVIIATCSDIDLYKARFGKDGVDMLKIGVEVGSCDDAFETANVAFKTGAEWVVVDGYHFNGEYRKQLRNAGLKVLMVDDYGQLDDCNADIVLNQNIYAGPELYSSVSGMTKLLMGTQYALLRKEFLSHSVEDVKLATVARRVLVTLGGGDSTETLLKIIDALNECFENKYEVKIVVGASSLGKSQIEHVLEESVFDYELLWDVWDMPGLMEWADVGITGAGSTTLEAAYMGLPCLLLVLADNQALIAEGLVQSGVSICIGDMNSISSSDITQALLEITDNQALRSKMRLSGRMLVDGMGVQRVLDSMRGKTL